MKWHDLTTASLDNCVLNTAFCETKLTKSKKMKQNYQNQKDFIMQYDPNPQYNLLTKFYQMLHIKESLPIIFLPVSSIAVKIIPPPSILCAARSSGWSKVHLCLHCIIRDVANYYLSCLGKICKLPGFS